MPKKVPTIGYNVELYFENDSWNMVNQSRSALYEEAIKLAGGKPYMLHYDHNLDKELKKIDGYLFTGGKDLPSHFYNEEPSPKLLMHQFSDKRFRFEKEILERIRGKMPILGICLGAQFLNVVSGGSLVQHLPNFKEHRQGSNRIITLSGDSLIAKVLGKQTMTVACYHHQAVQDLGSGLKITGYDEKDIPHVIESQDANEWMIGVQFHPERFIQDEDNEQIFRAFLIEAERRMERATEF